MHCQTSTIFLLLSLKTILLLLCLKKEAHADEVIDYQARLLDNMFRNNRIDPKKRPVTTHTDAVAVQAFLIILHVYRLDELTGTLTLNGWADFRWSDPQLQWDQTNYGGIESTEISEVTVWKPDIAILNPVDASTVFEYGKVLLYVSSDGMIHWLPPFRTRTSCPIDHRYFPYDEHICKVQLGSWSYDISRLTLHTLYEKVPEEKVFKQFSVENPLWELVDNTVQTINVSMECCPQFVFPHIEYTLRLRRRSPLYKFVFVMPSVMSTFLTLAMFWLPTNASEKFTLGGISAIIQIALLFVLSNTIPAGGTHIPHIVLFCGSSLVMTCFSLVISVMVVRISRSHTYTPLPSFLKNFLSGPLGKILCLGSNAQADTNLLTEDKKDLESLEENQNGTGYHYSEKPSCFDDWILFATAIDHTCFIIYSVTFAIILLFSFTM